MDCFRLKYKEQAPRCGAAAGKFADNDRQKSRIPLFSNGIRVFYCPEAARCDKIFYIWKDLLFVNPVWHQPEV